MSSSQTKPLTYLDENHSDEDYDHIDYEAEIGDGDEEQFAREGQLLQGDPDANNIYAKAVAHITKKAASLGLSTSMKDLASLKELTSMKEFLKLGQTTPAKTYKEEASGKACELISHTQISTLSPELAALVAAELSKNAKSIRKHTASNAAELEDLLSKVPEGQTELYRQIQGILHKEKMLNKGARKMEDFGDMLEDGDLAIKNGRWARKGRQL